MKTIHKWLALGATLALVTGGASFAAVAFASGATGPQLSVLNRPATAADQLPAAVANSPLASHLASANSARRAFAQAGTSVYLAAGTGNTDCLIITNSQYGATCAGLGTGAIYLTAPQTDGTMDVYEAVPDGYSTASAGGFTATVQNNAVWLHAVPLTATTLHLDGPNGSRDIDLGLQSPPNP